MTIFLGNYLQNEVLTW